MPRGKKERKRFELLGEVAVGLISVLVISVFLGSSIDRYFITSEQYASVLAAVLVDLANGDRAHNSLHTLTMNPVLVAAAQAKADDMAAKSYFAHVAPDGKDSWYWFKESGYGFSYAGENLAVDFSDSSDVERAWMNSPTHRQNLLDPHFTEIGIATAQGTFQGRVTTFVVQMFGTSTSPTLADGSQVSVASSEGSEIEESQIQGETSESNPLVNSDEITKTNIIKTPRIDAGITAKTASTAALAFLAFGFIMDMAIVSRKKIPRIVGHNLDHIMIISMFVFFLIIMKSGVIL